MPTPLPQGARTLRFRLMVWNAGVVILTAFVTLLIVREGVRFSLLDEMDQVLIEDLNEIGLAAKESHGTDFSDLRAELNRKATGHSQHGWFIQFLNSDRTVRWSSVNTPDLPGAVPVSAERFPTSFSGERLVEQSIRVPGHDSVTIRIGASLDFLEQDMARIDKLTVTGAGVVLIIAPLGGYWLAGRATRPLGNIIETTARLRPSEMQERLQIRHTGDELDRLSLTINGLLDRIAAYLNHRRDFIANAAHELRTPLAAIRSSVEVAMNGSRSPSEYEELLGELIDECQMLETLVNQLLLLAESDADGLKIHGERVDLSEVIVRSVEMFRGAAEARDIAIDSRITRNVVVEGNRPHLRQVINNLLDNAIKYTPSHGHIRVRLYPDTISSLVVLDVQDDGSGIPANDLPHVFERFYRGDKSRQREGLQRGTGLGLSICKAIIEAHRGAITAESEPNRGSLFRVTLPALNGDPWPGPDAARQTRPAETIAEATAGKVT